MSENKSETTPGPWRLEAGTTLVWGACNPDITDAWGLGFPVAEARRTRSHGPQTFDIEEAEANARLIAAAPETKAQRDELLAALTAIGVFPDGYCFCFGHIREPHKPEHEHTGECQAARTAIRRAQGGGDE